MRPTLLNPLFAPVTTLPGVGPNPSAGNRGISYWPGATQAVARIVIATTNGFLIQLDAKTGKPLPEPIGVVNLSTGVTEKFGGGYATNTAPAIYKNLAIVAARTGEQGRYGLPGDPRAFNVITGEEVWRFHVVPGPEDENFGTWGLNGWQDRRGPGVWVPMTVDPVNDLVFVPLGNATDQNFGNSRPGLNLYATTLLAIQASTGKRKWHFQLTHHDICDWDVNSPPALIEAMKDGQRVPAVAQMTNQGLLFIFNRLTGEPIFGVEERPVPRFDALGDQAWPTQPFPLKPAGLTRDSMTRAEVSKISPEAEKYCTEVFDKAVNMGPYTPYGMLPSLVFPGSEGGGGWGGVAANPALGLVFVNTRHLGVIAQLQPMMSSNVLPSFSKSKVPTNFYTDPQGYPCNAPPWSELVAVSTSTGDIVWRTPLGEYKDLTAKGILGTGTALNDGGPIATASGLVFIGATADLSFRAFDAKTGKELWRTTLAPAGRKCDCCRLLSQIISPAKDGVESTETARRVDEIQSGANNEDDYGPTRLFSDRHHRRTGCQGSQRCHAGSCSGARCSRRDSFSARTSPFDHGRLHAASALAPRSR